MKTYIILLAVDMFDRKKDAEDIENRTYTSLQQFYDEIGYNTRAMTDEDVLVYELANFVDACNDQELELELWWVTYINIK